MRKRCLTVTVMIVIMLVALYMATSEPVVYSVFANITNKPVFRFPGENAVCLVTAYSGESEILENELSTLHENGVNITVYVSSAWAERHSETILNCSGLGHEFALLGEDGNVEAQLQTFASATGQDTASFMPNSGVYTSEMCAKLKENSLPMVLWSKDSRAFPAQTKETFACAFDEKVVSGDIVYVVLNAFLCDAASELGAAGYEFITVKEALEN